jgi:hypothetical protein
MNVLLKFEIKYFIGNFKKEELFIIIHPITFHYPPESN